MKTISASLKEGIASGSVATFVRIEAADGTIFGFTNHDVELTFVGVVYKPTPALERISMNQRGNAEVGNQEFAGGWVVDLPEEDLGRGKYDDAVVSVFRADWRNPDAGIVSIFEGTLGLIQWTEDGFRADVHSLMRQLSRIIGIEVTAACRHNLFNTNSGTTIGACQLSEASYATNTSVTAVTNTIEFELSGVSEVDGYFANGLLSFTSGLNDGLDYEVKSWNNTTKVIELFLPTRFIPSISDTVRVRAGCDKTAATCKSKFNNIVNFGGFPHIRNEINFK